MFFDDETNEPIGVNRKYTSRQRASWIYCSSPQTQTRPVAELAALYGVQEVPEVTDFK